jgi:hypothetical protein
MGKTNVDLMEIMDGRYPLEIRNMLPEYNVVQK